MKKIFAILSVAFSVALVACGDKKTENGKDWFLTPEVTVDGLTAEVSCLTRFGDGVLEGLGTGFTYLAVAGEVTGNSVDVAGRVDGSRISAALSGLAPETTYSIIAYVDLPTGRVTSGYAVFGTPKDPGPGPDPDPDPDPDPGLTKYTGWAELPVWKKNDTDYHYVAHFCAMGTSSGAPTARNFSACFSASMKCPVWVAAPLHDAYAVKNVKRQDNYRDDPDIPASIQVGKWSGYTRGHMLGSAERLVSREANNQVMYFSNIGPQLGQAAYFNTGGGQWNTAEGWVDKQWRGLADTCYQVVGTSWSGSQGKIVDGTTIPDYYYIVLLKAKKSVAKKWVIDCTRDELQCIGIWIEHKPYTKSEVVKPENYASKGIFMPVSEIEKKTGHTFFVHVAQAPKDSYNVSDWNF